MKVWCVISLSLSLSLFVCVCVCVCVSSLVIVLHMTLISFCDFDFLVPLPPSAVLEGVDITNFGAQACPADVANATKSRRHGVLAYDESGGLSDNSTAGYRRSYWRWWVSTATTPDCSLSQ